MPHLVKMAAMFSSLICRGVLDEVSSFSCLTPLLLLGPTAQTTAFPIPLETRVEERRNGSGVSLKLLSPAACFLTGLASLLSACWYRDSSIERSWPSMRIQSAGILEPVSRRIISPTTRSQMLILYVAPYLPLTTAIFSSFTKLTRLTNCLSLTQSFAEVMITMMKIAT